MFVDLIKRALLSISSRGSSQNVKQLWKSNIYEEIDFWQQWLTSGGGPWPADFRFRRDPNAPFQQDIARHLDVSPEASLDVLDVGAGPLTFLGKQWQGHDLRIVAVDPLADEYDRLLSKCGIEPLVRTRLGHAEKLTDLFSRGTFDLVTASNCIDHSYDPLLAIRQMVAVLKPKGLLYMTHNINEATTQEYGGLHQWNFFDRDGHFCIGSKQETVDVTQELIGEAEITNQQNSDGKRIINLIRKCV